MEQCRQGKSAKWIRNPGKGLAARGGPGVPVRTRRCVGGCCGCSRGESGSPRAAGDGRRERLLRGPSSGVERPARAGYGQGESICLIKTKHCDGPDGCLRNVIYAGCCECQSEEIQPSAGKRRE
ncbi:hypothetical protein RND71_019107 [Anisodus tanguticus]|uniref:Uncharacterized protein n=1 Tax=Anisodus tanguticus TaxID=243964 RepID=A0AAE1RYF5_9SOLA|nr:hypothetical protein RND71_019107 [Anisodus tanguticus]